MIVKAELFSIRVLFDLLIICLYICEIDFVDEVAIFVKDIESISTLEKDSAIAQESRQVNRFLEVIEKWVFAGIGLLIELHLVMIFSSILIDVVILL